MILTLKHIQQKMVISMLPIFVLFQPIDKLSAQDFSQQNETFWHTNTTSGITWDLTTEKRLPHEDNIELSGSLVSGIIRYKVSPEKQVTIVRDIIFPQLRNFTKANESMYRAYLRSNYEDNVLPVIILGDKKYEPGTLDSVTINGKISFHFKQRDGVQVIRTFLPSMNERAFLEKWTLINTTKEAQTLKIGATEFNQNEAGWNGQYHRKISTDAKPEVILSAGEKYEFGIFSQLLLMRSVNQKNL